MKSTAAGEAVQVRWGGGGHAGAGHRGLGFRGRALGAGAVGTVIAGAYYGSHPYYGGACAGDGYYYEGCAPRVLHSITANPAYPVPYPYYSY
jgi:hypothetical protein